MSNLDSLVLEPIEQPLSNTPNMLSNEDRVLCNMTPLQRLYSIDEDTYEELVCVWAYSCLGNKGYTEVYRVGQAGDKGRDVLAYYDRVKGAFDLYQCKQYKSALTYSDLCGEMGKLLIYTFNNTYPIPQNYYILCPKDVSQSFVDLLSNNGKNLKIKLKNDWETVINKKVGTNWVALNEELSTYIDEFNFNIIKKIEPIKFIDEIRQSPYYFYYFGGGFNMIKRTPLQVPHSPINTERNYIQNLNLYNHPPLEVRSNLYFLYLIQTQLLNIMSFFLCLIFLEQHYTLSEKSTSMLIHFPHEPQTLLYIIHCYSS